MRDVMSSLDTQALKDIAAKFTDVYAFKAHCRRLKNDRYTLGDKVIIERILRGKVSA